LFGSGPVTGDYHFEDNLLPSSPLATTRSRKNNCAAFLEKVKAILRQLDVISEMSRVRIMAQHDHFITGANIALERLGLLSRPHQDFTDEALRWLCDERRNDRRDVVRLQLLCRILTRCNASASVVCEVRID
jgi:hypothetical protein